MNGEVRRIRIIRVSYFNSLTKSQMDKLQWFKFTPSEWIMGKIQRAPEVTQARFMRLLCVYWGKDCLLSVEDAEIEIDKDHLDILIAKRVIKTEQDFIKIDFLDDQLSSITNVSQKRKDAVNERWRKYRERQNLTSASGISSNESDKNTNVLDSDTNVLQNDTEKSRVKSIDIDNTLMSEIKISDDEKFFIVGDNYSDATSDEILYFKIAEQFRQTFIKNLTDKGSIPTHQKKAKYKTYVPHIRLMITDDEVTVEHLREALRFLKGKDDDFWKSNILSTAKLRKQIPTLLAKKNEKKPNTSKPVERL